MEKPDFVNQFSLIIIGIVSATIAFSQPPAVEWERIFGGDSTDVAYSIQQTHDGGFVYGGETKSFGASGKDALLVKTDNMGYVEWYRLYGGIEADLAHAVQQTSDTGYILIGITCSFGSGPSDMYLIKTDSQGDTLWTRTYGREYVDDATSGQQTADGGYILAGSTRTYSGPMEIYLVKTDSLGDTLWTRAYGGSYDINIRSILQIVDEGYILAGVLHYDGSTGYDYYLARTDSLGDTLWTRTYGGTDIDWAWSVEQTEDGGFMIAGSSESFGAGASDMYLVKTDSAGDTMWTRTYGGTGGESASAIQQTPDGGCIVAGGTTSFGAESGDLYLVKIDALGDTMWTLVYAGADIEYAYSIACTDDSGYIVGGAVETFEPPYYYWVDCLLVKTGPDTCSTHAPAIQWVSHPKDFALHPAYPNPFNPVTTISFDMPFQSKVSMNIYNILGERVAVLVNGYAAPGNHQLRWDAGDSPSGIYFVRMETREFQQTAKVVLLK